MGSRAFGLMVLAGLWGSAQAAPTLHDQLTALAKDITYTTAGLFPTQATALGIPGHDGELDTPSEANRAAYIARLQQWQTQLAQLGPPDHASLVDRDDALLLRAQLVSSLNTLQYRAPDRKDYAGGANTVVGAIFNQLQFLPV